MFMKWQNYLAAKVGVLFYHDCWLAPFGPLSLGTCGLDTSKCLGISSGGGGHLSITY